MFGIAAVAVFGISIGFIEGGSIVERIEQGIFVAIVLILAAAVVWLIVLFFNSIFGSADTIEFRNMRHRLTRQTRVDPTEINVGPGRKNEPPASKDSG